MTGQADLSGQLILVVEDDYYLANDAARALREAGASVLGPCPTEDTAREELAGVAPTCALLDINLRGGRSFGLAREFLEKGTPFVFITGYDQDVIPPEFGRVTRLQKPVAARQIIGALADVLGVSG
jgi:DNA-binding response OmpR family regulator